MKDETLLLLLLAAGAFVLLARRQQQEPSVTVIPANEPLRYAQLAYFPARRG